ncbi:hypothetical protein SLEP1_g42451 [Rubroshorea leprosula]|uniref:Uncharacterized protein n=1 Tax=Rubroshorea leprosula TaxID=152421 RepID=A0AAV5L9W3_9ROSI|nr:hypothetical protein SLEP1_g42451 [Rubroshorea leprosula]
MGKIWTERSCHIPQFFQQAKLELAGWGKAGGNLGRIQEIYQKLGEPRGIGVNPNQFKEEKRKSWLLFTGKSPKIASQATAHGQGRGRNRADLEFLCRGEVSKLQISFLNKKSKKKSSFLTGFSKGGASVVGLPCSVQGEEKKSRNAKWLGKKEGKIADPYPNLFLF